MTDPIPCSARIVTGEPCSRMARWWLGRSRLDGVCSQHRGPGDTEEIPGVPKRRPPNRRPGVCRVCGGSCDNRVSRCRSCYRGPS